MKRLLPLIVLLVMGVMLMISWSNISEAKTEVAEKYSALMKQGEVYEKKQIYVDAVTKYEAAFKLKPEYDLALRIAKMYQDMRNDNGYIKYINEALSCDKSNPDPYFTLIHYYRDTRDNAKLFQILNTTQKAFADSEALSDEQRSEMNDLLKKLMSEITVHAFAVDEFYGFHRYEGKGEEYTLVRVGDKYGLMTSSLSNYTQIDKEFIGYPNGGLIPIFRDGEYFFIDSAGNRKIVADEPATAVGAFGAGLAPLQVDGKYGYIDTKMRESHFEYEYAGSFENGIAPVKQNGKWFVINTQFAAIGPNFDEILIDKFGFCAPYGVYFGKSGDSWGMYNTAGEKIADGFEEVRQFASKQPAAVKKDGKWCFVSLSGEIVLETEYADADSFSLGYAPVKTGSLWGCINQQGEILVDPQFNQLSSFNHSGYAIGENEKGLCTVFIKQYK